MDANVVKEINYLTRLIEQHKKGLPPWLQSSQRSLNNYVYVRSVHEKAPTVTTATPLSMKVVADEKNNSTSINTTVTRAKVHVNPNFKRQNPVIHINPKICAKPMVHVNPNMMKNVCTNKESTINVSASKQVNNVDYSLKPEIKRSVYVNPKLMTKLSSTSQNNVKSPEKKQKQIEPVTTPVCSRLKLVKGVNVPKTLIKKQQSSSLTIISKRKLVRIRRCSKSSNASPIDKCKLKKPLNISFKKVKVSPMKVIKSPKVIDIMKQSASAASNFVKNSNIKPTINRYRIDRTKSEKMKVKHSANTKSKAIINNKVELVTIGGIVYKSSKNQLIRNSYTLKRKKPTSAKNEKFIMTTNGKKLRRVKSTKEAESNTALPISIINRTKLSTNILQKSNHKTNISNKVKQRSIQILRNKMRKNNQPCLIFQRFGYCANHEKGTCRKLHDKKQVSLCKKFLQGNCLMDKCQLSHDVGPEKMPTCKYFLEGCCVRDACPYRHVKVSSKTPICIEFLQGYCAKGQECKRRHEYLCPEFEKEGKCSKGKYCPYPHKPHAFALKQTENTLKEKQIIVDTIEKTTNTGDSVLPPNIENRLRYYEQTETVVENINKMRDSVLKKVRIMKRVNIAQNSECVDLNESSDDSDTENESKTTIDVEIEKETQCDTKCSKRPPIGTLPAYIPIN